MPSRRRETTISEWGMLILSLCMIAITIPTNSLPVLGFLYGLILQVSVYAFGRSEFGEVQRGHALAAVVIAILIAIVLNDLNPPTQMMGAD